MTIHREGYFIILSSGLIILAINILLAFLLPEQQTLRGILAGVSAMILLAIASFFRIPFRDLETGDYKIIAPADGKVVVVEEVEEPEYFKDKRIQVSIFMSPANVHVNRNPIAGEVKYVKYHPGQYLVAWHPKSSTHNERNSVVVGNQNLEVLIKQIAGKLARRIVCYSQEGQWVNQNEELGFIKFGSRVDLFLPLGTKINVNLQDKVKGGITVVGEVPEKS